MSEERYMRAYYHTFTPTGNDSIDAILEAVAIAGKRYHHTGDWTEEEWRSIQQAAEKAAAPQPPADKDIVLPPLPDDDDGQSGLVKQALRAYARAAVLADRKRR